MIVSTSNARIGVDNAASSSLMETLIPLKFLLCVVLVSPDVLSASNDVILSGSIDAA